MEARRGERASAIGREFRSAEPGRDHDVRYLASSALECGAVAGSVVIVVRVCTVCARVWKGMVV